MWATRWNSQIKGNETQSRAGRGRVALYRLAKGMETDGGAARLIWNGDRCVDIIYARL